MAPAGVTVGTQARWLVNTPVISVLRKLKLDNHHNYLLYQACNVSQMTDFKITSVIRLNFIFQS